jgi:nucleoside-diphosphate-sugar epimerase
MVQNEAELEELLSRPTERDERAASAMSGALLILGAGGKMGPTLAMRAKRAGVEHVIAVARFSSGELADRLRLSGIEVIASDLLEPGALEKLPNAHNVVFMAAMKFGTTGAEHTTWAMNAYLPGLVAERYRDSRIVAFSTGNVYPLVPVTSGGATEETTPQPVGEYAQSALGRERMFQYGSHTYGTPVVMLRLNYATELRYGVLMDIGQRVYANEPVDVSMGMVNVIWQGDANSACIQSFEHVQSPPLILNLTGPETLSVRWIANEFGRRFDMTPQFIGEEAPTALLSNSSKAVRLFGYPELSPGQMIDLAAVWIERGGTILGKPTRFEVRDGQF